MAPSSLVAPVVVGGAAAAIVRCVESDNEEWRVKWLMLRTLSPS